MTSDEAHDKVLKLRTLAAPGSGATADEAATAAHIANQICVKFRISPQPRHILSSAPRALPGRIDPAWPPRRRQQQREGTSWWQWAARSFGSDEAGVSGVTDMQARAMALSIIYSGMFLTSTQIEVCESALNGLLTEYGKILLDGVYSLL